MLALNTKMNAGVAMSQKMASNMLILRDAIWDVKAKEHFGKTVVVLVSWIPGVFHLPKIITLMVFVSTILQEMDVFSRDTQAGFQIDALRSAFDWLIFKEL